MVSCRAVQLGSGVGSNLEGGDVQILPKGQTKHVQVLTAISKRTCQCDEDYREEGEELEGLLAVIRTT